MVTRLRDARRVELAPGADERAILYVANSLASVREHASLISSLSAALLACPEVVELYADEEELKDLVDDLGG